MPGVSLAPRCTCTGVPERSACASPCHNVSCTSMRSLDSAIAGDVSHWPREMTSLARPASATAQRWPATACSTAWFCACRLRTRTRVACDAGTSSSSSPTCTAPACTVPVTTVPTPSSVKARSMASRKPRCASRGVTARCACPNSQACNAATPSPVVAETHEHRRAGERRGAHQRSHLAAHGLQARGIHAIGLGDHHRTARHAEQRQHRQVLARLRHHAIVGGHQQQREVDAGGAGQHRVHQAFVAGHVDEADALARRCVEERITQLDADAALLLFRQTIGVHAGECPHQRGLAVVDVTGRADDHRERIV